MFRGRFRRRRFARSVARISRRASGITLAKRIVLDGLTIPDVTSVSFDNPLVVPLIVCQESMNEETESNGTAIAEVPLYSRLTSMRMRTMVHGMSTGSVIRWILQKAPDGEQLTTSLVDASFHGSDDTQNQREARKYTLAKGMIFVNPNNQSAPLPVFVKRKTWARASPMRENDRINLIIAKDAAGTTGNLSGFGTIWARANG